MNKRLYKSTKDRKVCGVCAGIAEYLNIDPTIVRLIAAILILVYGTGLLAYIIAALVLSDAPADSYDADNVIDNDDNNN